MRILNLLLAAGTVSLIACAAAPGDDADQSSSSVDANIPVHVIRRNDTLRILRPEAQLTAIVRSQISLAGYREARVEELQNASGSHLLVQLLVDGQHAMKLARIDLDGTDNVLKVSLDHQRTQEDEVHGTAPHAYACPDPSVQFIAFCPNDNAQEIGWTNEVGDAAEAAGLKTVRLIKETATHDAWLNYMACPNLVGNFYDGDANPDEIVVNDGSITAREFATSVNFNSRTTNIWLACEAYNDPMLTAVQTTAKSQKYAAGINDLRVGPSDRTAVCTMKAAIEGKAMTQAFHDCYKQLDISSDQWGFDGAGSDFFGKAPNAVATTP